jgi:hypothetical protein
MRKHKETNMQWFFSTMGLVCLLTALFLAVPRTETIVYPGPQPPPAAGSKSTVTKDLPASWGASEGFAMAGGLCFIAAALVVMQTKPATATLPSSTENNVPRQIEQRVRA